LGQDNFSVLKDLGIKDTEIQSLIDEGIVGKPSN
jgi:crotonobetainyl-CoA:carnitine CoA-transferase CaiB-like acyl-CoA transferase